MKAMNPFNNLYYVQRNAPEATGEVGDKIKLLDFVKVPATIMLADGDQLIDEHLELFMPTTGSKFVDELFKLNTLVSYKRDPFLVVNFDLKERVAHIPEINRFITQCEDINKDNLVLTSRSLMLNNIQLCPSEGIYYSHNDPISENYKLIPDELEAAVRKVLESGIKCGMTELVFDELQFQVRMNYDKVTFISPAGYQTASCLVTEDIGKIASLEEFINERKVEIINRIDSMAINIGGKSYRGSECIDGILDEFTLDDFTCTLGNSFITLTKDELSYPQLREYLTWTLFAYIVSGRLDSRLIESKPCKNPYSE